MDVPMMINGMQIIIIRICIDMRRADGSDESTERGAKGVGG
jgi:hypothetical protein